MTTTRRALIAKNTELQARLKACDPESRQGLRAKIAATRKENESLKTQLSLLRLKYEPQPAAA
jgi:hypothetical protein